MPAVRLCMRQIVEILRLAREQDCSIRQIAVPVGLPHSTVGDYLRRFAATGLPWPEARQDPRTPVATPGEFASARAACRA